MTKSPPFPVDPTHTQPFRRKTLGVLFSIPLLTLFSSAQAQSVPIVDTEPPQIATPADLLLPDAAPETLVPAYVLTLTDIAPGGVAITDEESGNAVAQPTGSSGPFPPGNNTLTWTATDLGSNTATVEQAINVIPQAYLAADQAAVPGGTAQISVHLTGAAANYPVTIPYTVSGTAVNPDDHDAVSGALVINAPDTSASLTVNIAPTASAGRQIDIDFDTAQPPTNALVGLKTHQRIAIIDANLPPVVRLSARQNSAPTRDIFSGAGVVTVTAQAHDPNPGASLSYDWSASDNALVPLSGIFGTSFSFDPAALVEGRYTARVTVSDGVNGHTAELALDLLGAAPSLSDDVDSDGDQLVDAVDGPGDEDNDGIPNYLDALDTAWWLPGWPASADVTPGLKTEDTFAAGNLDVTWQASGFLSPLVTYFLLIVTDPGLELALGPIAQAGYAQARVPINDAESALGVPLPDNRRSAEGYVVDLEVNGLSPPGQTVRLTLPLIAPLPQPGDGDLDLMVFTEAGQWLSFSPDGQNSFGSATRVAVPNQDITYCPPPVDADQLSASMSEGETCLHIVLTDGGPNDRDGLANGRVLLTATPVFNIEPEPPAPPPLPPPDSIESFVESLNKTDTGSGGGALFILPALLAAARLTGKWNNGQRMRRPPKRCLTRRSSHQ